MTDDYLSRAQVPQLTHVQVSVDREQNILVLHLESNLFGIETPKAFEVALDLEQANAVLQSLQDGIRELR